MDHIRWTVRYQTRARHNPLLSYYIRSMSDLVSLAWSLAEELVGQREFGTDLEETAQVCLEYLAKVVEAERFE